MKKRNLTLRLIIIAVVMGTSLVANAQSTTLSGLISLLTQAQGYITQLTSTNPYNAATAAILQNNTFGINTGGLGAVSASSVIGTNGLMTGNTTTFGNVVQAAMNAAKQQNSSTAAAQVQQNLNQAAIYGVNTQAYTGSKNTNLIIQENTPYFTTGADPSTVYQSNLDATTHTAQMVGQQGAVLNNITAQNTLTLSTLGLLNEGQQQDRQRTVSAQAEKDNKELATYTAIDLSNSVVQPK